MHPRYSQPGLSRLVQRMEADGLVERRADPDDRRATIVVTTRAGRRQFTAANAVYADALRESFGRHLDPAEHGSSRLCMPIAHRASRATQAVVALVDPRGRVGFGATLDKSFDVGSGGNRR